MKKFRLAVINFLCLLIVIIYILIAGYYQVWKDVGWLAGEKPPYYKTRDYAQNVKNSIEDLTEYIRLRENFEKDGRLDGKRLVDVYNYAEQGRIDGSVPNGLAYTLQQLVEWGKQQESYKWWAKYIEKNENNTYNSAMPKSVEGTLDELYPPRGFNSIAEFVMSEENLKRASEEQWMLDLALCLTKISDEMADYMKFAERFKSGNTNIRYQVENLENGQVYTNIRSEEEKENSTRLIFQGDTYFLDTDIPMDYDMRYDIIRNIHESLRNTEMYSVSVWIDRDFAVKDELWGGSRFYAKWSFFVKTFPLGLVVAVLLFAGTLAALCVASGKSTEKKNVVWGCLDQIPIELVVIPMGFIIYMGVLVAREGLGMVLPPPEAALRITALVGLYAFFLIGVLSLVRRRKERILFQRSILWQVFHNYKTGIMSGKTAVMFILLFCLYVLATVFGSQMGVVGIVIVVFVNLYIGGLVLREVMIHRQLLDGSRRIAEGDFTYKIPLEDLTGDHVKMARNINRIGDNLEMAVQESVRNERRKTDLIANVSHDLKTPLTSIITYVDLLKRENTINPKIEEYVDVLEKKTERLKVLMEDLVEVSRINSGNFPIQNQQLDFREFLQQIQGEFYEQLRSKELQMINSMPDEKIFIYADGRALWRVMENLYGNIAKYAMPGSRVYADLKVTEGRALFELKNISVQPLNIDADELLERFTQGDESRSTEGSGLGLSIARNLVSLMGGTFEIYLDGDLFKTSMSFPLDEDRGLLEG